MLKYAYLVLLLLAPFFAFGQDNEELDEVKAFQENLCDFIPDTNGVAKGLDIKFRFPCVWNAKDGERPGVLKTFEYNMGRAAYFIVVSIIKNPTPFSQKEIDFFHTPKAIRDVAASMGKYVSNRTVKIDGIKTGEIEVLIERDPPTGKIHGHGLAYFVPYKNYIISMFYGVCGGEQEFADFLFNNSTTLFKVLATKTIVLDQWKLDR